MENMLHRCTNELAADLMKYTLAQSYKWIDRSTDEGTSSIHDPEALSIQSQLRSMITIQNSLKTSQLGSTLPSD